MHTYAFHNELSIIKILLSYFNVSSRNDDLKKRISVKFICINVPIYEMIVNIKMSSFNGH